MSVLSHQTIKKLCRGRNPLVTPYSEAQVRTASYDLRLGTEYFLSSSSHHMGCIRIGELGDRHRKVIEIPANQVIVVRTMENVKLNSRLVGHLSLKVELLFRGVIMASQSQVDAGYEGPIFALLYNLSSEPVSICFGESVLRLEFMTLDYPTEQTYQGHYRPGFGLADALERSLTSSLSSMATTVTNLKRLSIIAVAGLLAAFVGIAFALLGPLQQESSDANATSSSAETNVATLRSEVDTLSAQIAILQDKLNTENQRLSELAPLPSASP